MHKLISAGLLTLLAALLVLATLLSQSDIGTAQGPVEMGADADPSGNSETSLGAPDGCVSVNTGDTFDLDIFISDVEELIHWELYLRFKPPIVKVVDADMHMFLDVNSYSSLKTQWVPLSGGRHFLGAADLRGAPESGSGVLARLTLEALEPGLGYAEIYSQDFDGDGKVDLGPRLTASGGVAVGDVTGDGIFDGPTYHAFVAVDESCGTASPTPTLPPSPTPQPGGGTAPPDTPPPDVLPVPGDPSLEPSADTSPPGDGGSASESSQDSTTDGESEDGSEAGAGEEDADGVDADGDEDSEDGSAPAALAREGTPAPTNPDDDSAPVAAGGSSASSSSGGGVPLWAVGSIAAAVLVAAAAASVLLAARAGGRFGR